MPRKDVWNAVHAWEHMDEQERREFLDRVNAIADVSNEAIIANQRQASKEQTGQALIRLIEKVEFVKNGRFTPEYYAANLQIEKLRGHAEGYELAVDDINQHMIPGLHLMRLMTNIIQYINGLAASEISKEGLKKQIEDPRSKLAPILDEIDVLNAKVRERYEREDIFFNTSIGFAYRDALVRIESGEVVGGHEIRNLAKEFGGESMETQNLIRLDYFNAPTDSVRIRRDLLAKTSKTESAASRGIEVMRMLREMQKDGDWSNEHYLTLHQLEEWQKDEVLGESIRKDLSRWKL